MEISIELNPEQLNKIKEHAIREWFKERNAQYTKKYIDKNREKWNAYQKEWRRKKNEEKRKTLGESQTQTPQTQN